MGWIEFALAMGLFLASHRLFDALGLKLPLQARLGNHGFTLLFSVLSVALLIWVIAAAGRAPFVPVWDQQPWHRWAVNVAMPLAIALGSFGVGAPNPFAFEGRNGGYDPDRPGIVGVTRQPLLWALALWSGAHLLANGDLAHIGLFAPFAIFALLGMYLAERRTKAELGPTHWAQLAARTGFVPLAAHFSRRAGVQWPSLLRLGIALMLWAGFWHLHAPVIGVLPAP